MPPFKYRAILQTGCLLVGLLGCVGTPVPIDFLKPPKFDPSLQWQQIQTEHFLIYFHQGEEEAAQKASQMAEEVHTLLTPEIGWIPQERTHLVLTDQEDEANGYISFFPHNTITISLISSASMRYHSNQLDDWMRTVITHEYVHILQLDMHTKSSSAFRTLFGRYPFPIGPYNGPLPNIQQPFWLIEGLAVDVQTQRGGIDRSRGAYTDMLLRMAILENRFPTLDQAAGQLNSWPGPEVHYLFGARFLEYIRKRFGNDALKKLNINYSGALFPLRVDTNAKKTLGVSYLTLWDEWKAELTEHYTAWQNQLTAIGVTATQPLTKSGDLNMSPRIGPQGDIVYAHLNPYTYPALRLLKPSGANRLLARSNTLVGSVSFSPDQSHLAFTQIERWRNYARYNDLYLLNLQSAQVTRLTQGARLRDPDFHPEGTRLVAIQGEHGKDRLVLYDLHTRQLKPIPEMDDLLMHQPRWSPRGDKIAVSGWHKGFQDIYIFDMTSRQIRPIRQDKAMDVTPAWSPDGRYILFSSDRTGIYNLFAYQIETDTLFQVTHLIGGAFTPEVGPDYTIVFSSYHARGWDIHKLNWNQTEWKVETLKPINSAPVITDLSKEASKLSVASETAPLPAKPYSAGPTLRPRYWVPTELTYNSISGTTIGISTGGGDVLGKHRFTLDMSIHDRNLSYGINYINDTYRPTLYFHKGYLQDIEKPENSENIELGTRFDQIFFQRYASLSLGYYQDRFYSLQGITHTEGVTVSGVWDSTQYYPFSISPEEGHQWGIHYAQEGGYLRGKYALFFNRYDKLLKHNHVFATQLFFVKDQYKFTNHTYNRGLEHFFQKRASPFHHAPLEDELSLNSTAMGRLSYRFPIRNIERGFRTWPFFFSRWHGILFVQVENIENIRDENLFKRVGSEWVLNTTVVYHLPFQLAVGITKEMDPSGEAQTYFDLRSGF